MEMQEKRKKFYNMTDEWLQCAHFLDTYSTCRIEYVKMKYTIQKPSQKICELYTVVQSFHFLSYNPSSFFPVSDLSSTTRLKDLCIIFCTSWRVM